VRTGGISEGQSVILKDMVSGGRRVAVELAGWLAGQEQALSNARRASTEVSRRRVERDEVTLYLEALDRAHDSAAVSTHDWASITVKAAD
jgi:nucleoside-triphosphatase THEP1